MASQANGRRSKSMEPSEPTPSFDVEPPPQALDEERALIGSVLHGHGGILDEVSQFFRDDMLYGSAHRMIWSAATRLNDKGKPVDALTVAEALGKANQLEEVGGAPYLAQCMEVVPHAAHAAYYAGIVREKWQLRRVSEIGTDLLRLSREPGSDAMEAVSAAESHIHGLLENQAGAAVEIRSVLLDAFDEMLSGKTGLHTGFSDLDKLTGGISQQSVVIVAARTSNGKTAIASNIAVNVAKAGTRVLFVSLEQSRIELAQRLLCSEARFDSNNLRSGNVSESERVRLMECSNRLGEIPLMIEDDVHQRISRISALARLEKRRKGLGLIVIDYLQLITPDDSRQPREQQVSGISRGLKMLAKSVDVPVLCLAQVNREVEKGGDGKPKLSQLRESGAIEQDADQVWLIWRPSLYDAKRKDGTEYAETEAAVIVAKNRNGSTGEVWLHWVKEHTRFFDAASVSRYGGF